MRRPQINWDKRGKMCVKPSNHRIGLDSDLRTHSQQFVHFVERKINKAREASLVFFVFVLMVQFNL